MKGKALDFTVLIERDEEGTYMAKVPAALPDATRRERQSGRLSSG